MDHHDGLRNRNSGFESQGDHQTLNYFRALKWNIYAILSSNTHFHQLYNKRNKKFKFNLNNILI